MNELKVNGVRVIYPCIMGEAEAMGYLREQLTLRPDMRLAELEIALDGAEAVLRPHYDTVRRVRRITGYLSEVGNFGAAKAAEEAARVRHI